MYIKNELKNIILFTLPSLSNAFVNPVADSPTRAANFSILASHLLFKLLPPVLYI